MGSAARHRARRRGRVARRVRHHVDGRVPNSDFAIIETELEAIHARLARLLVGMLGGAALILVGIEAFLPVAYWVGALRIMTPTNGYSLRDHDGKFLAKCLWNLRS